MKKIDLIYDTLKKLQHASANEIAETLKLDRANTSRYLNTLFAEGKIQKQDGRPVKYTILDKPKEVTIVEKKFSLDHLIGASKSLIVPIQQAKAAILYPPRGLHTIILGETGVGKSMFAELMYQFSLDSKMIDDNAPFIRFNCADYAENPQLLMGQIFGVKKGAYTGADKDREGLLQKADGGIFFLDEVHRLSTQGQEMLFTFIDKGYFRRMGDTEQKNYVSAQIIAATTEEPESSLLSTFTRRIPMSIKLPPLRERGLKDRYLLIETFIKEESKRVQKSIYINKSALESFLLYDCPSNIGQLKSDIQLACAKAFLNFKSQNKNYILIEQGDLPQNVKRGHMQIKAYRHELGKLLKHQEDIYKFYFNEDETYLNEKENDTTYFYESIESRLDELKGKGLSNQEINDIMSVDIESHFNKYLVEMPNRIKKDEMTKLIDISILDLTEKLLAIASAKLQRDFDDKIFFGLALHLNGSIERIRSGQIIYHPKLNVIRVNYPEAFLVAMELAKEIDMAFEIETPLDEIGYLTMFLSSNPYEHDEEDEGTVGVLVIMHGNTTASSMAQVANELVGSSHCEALDMPLNMRPETMYELTKEKVKQINKGKGVLLMVDMGSLLNFSDMIYEETGIMVKCIDRVSTPILLDVFRKAELGRDLTEIYKSSMDAYQIMPAPMGIGKKNLIITACFTGEGASAKLKTWLTDKLTLEDNCEVISLNIVNKREFIGLVDYYQLKYHVLAIVSTIDINVPNIPNFTGVEVLSGEALPQIQALLAQEDIYSKINQSLKSHLKHVESHEMIKHVRQFIEQNENALRVTIPQDVKVGIALHLSFLIERLLSGLASKPNDEVAKYMSQYPMEMNITRESLWQLSQTFDVVFSESDIAYMCKMFLSNDITATRISV